MNTNIDMDELFSDVKVIDTSFTENSLTSKERRARWWREIKKQTDWSKLPFYILMVIILMIGAVLMGNSIYKMTHNLPIAIFSPAFTELGLFSAHVAGDRVKNSTRQKEIAKRLRGWHIFTTVALLISNLLIDTATSMLDIKIDGIIYFIYAIVGLTAFFNLVSFTSYQDADDELTTKHEQAKRLESIKSQTIKSKMDAYADAEEIKSKAMVEFWKEHAPALAKNKALLEAAGEIKKLYSDLGNMTTEEAEKLLNGFGLTNESESEKEFTSNGNGKRPYNKTGQYSKKNSVPEKVGETNFPSGTTPTDEETQEAIRKLKEQKNQEV